MDIQVGQIWNIKEPSKKSWRPDVLEIKKVWTKLDSTFINIGDGEFMDYHVNFISKHYELDG